MERHSSLEALPEGLRMVVAIGVFDGVHRGHRAFIGRLVRGGASKDARSVLVTFQPHPASVLRGTPAGSCATRSNGRPAWLSWASITSSSSASTPPLPPQSAEDFVARLQVGRRLVALVMTTDSAFGRGRAGNLASMQALGAQEGFDVVQVGQHHSQGIAISSSRIRAAIEAGRLAEAARLLGHRYAVTGTVVHGDARGRALGFPTANLAFEAPVALPPDGIYAVRVSWGGGPLQPDRRADGVASLGVRPTFGDGSRVLEVFLLDFDEDLYDARLRVEFVRRQRGERRFASSERLVDQMQRDVTRARAVLAAAPTLIRRPLVPLRVAWEAHRACQGADRPCLPLHGPTARLRRFKDGRESSEDRVPLTRETKEASSPSTPPRRVTRAPRRSRSRS